MSQRPARTRLAGLIGLLTLVAITAGLPVVLLRFGGSPIPSRLPSWQHIVHVLAHRDNGSLFLGAVRDVSWLAWAAFTIAVLAEVQAVLRGRQSPALHLAGIQGAAGRLVAVASLAFTTPAVVTLAASPAMAASTTHQPAARQLPPVELTAWQAPAQRTVVVHPGDCLWTIAQRYLGSGERYLQIVDLNLGHDMGAGETFTDPSLILPGWQLRLPPAAHTPPAQTPGQHDGPGQHDEPGQHDGHPSGNQHFRSRHPGAGHQGTGQPGTGQPGTGHQGTGQPGTGRTAQGGAGSPGTADPGQPQAAGPGARSAQAASTRHDEVGQVALFSLGMLAGAALAALERLRRRQRQHRRPGRRIALPADDASRRIECKLRAAAPPASSAPPESLRDAMHDLSEGIIASGEALPPIVGIHLAAGTVDVLLSAPAAGPPPAPFTIAPARQAMCWTAELHDAQPSSTPAPPAPGEVGDFLPGLFTAGVTDSGGYLLLDLEAMRVTCCGGPDDLADRLLVTAATELAASRWSGWYELILAGCEELEVLGRAEQCQDLDDALDVLEARAATVSRRIGADPQADVRACRLEDPEDEDWGLTLLVSRVQPTPAQMSRLLDLADGPGGIAALVAGDTQSDDGKVAPALIELSADQDSPGEMVATITLAHLGPGHQITVWPQTLTVPEYEALAGLFATAARTADVSPDAAPYADYGGPPWLRLAAAPVATTEQDEFTRPVAGPEPAVRRAEVPGQRYEPDQDDQGADEPDWSESGWNESGWNGQDLDGQSWGDPDWDDSRSHASAGYPSRPWRHQDASPRRVAPGLSVSVLGPLEVSGSAEPLQPKQAELVLALALHSPVGVPNSSLCALLGADADHPRPGDSVRQLITRTRRRLGRAPDGQEYIAHLGSGIYALHTDARLDWAGFSALAVYGRAERSRADLRAAMSMVRGQPFADCFHWWIDIALIETIRAEIVDTADMLAHLELAAGDPRAAGLAARAGLNAESTAEQLWRALMRAEHEAGNQAGVTQAWTGCLDAIAEIAPGADPHPDTELLFRQLTRGAVPALNR